MKEISAAFINPLDAASDVFAVLAQQNSINKAKLAHHARSMSLTELNNQCSSKSVDHIIRTRVVDGVVPDGCDAEDAFFVGDMGEVARQQAQWVRLLPRVEPFYAVKCNPDPMVLKTLAGLHTGFDCASRTEIQMALDQGVAPSKIIYANPCKQSSHIRFAASVGVTMMTFDNADELRKIRKVHPNPQMVLRIRTDDSRSICQLGTKFGAMIDNVPYLLRVAKSLDMDVIGISFHVGSGCFDASAFGEAVVLARKAFDMGEAEGFKFRLLDIGGGFPGRLSDGVQFQEIADILRPAIDQLFDPSVRVIAEPGRYYVSSAFTLSVNITSRRAVARDRNGSVATASADDHPSFMYYVNDGVYGSFNCIMFDHQHCTPRVLMRNGVYHYVHPVDKHEVEYPCSVWGPTCDSIDCIGKNFSLPELEVGDWLYFDNMGAYTMCAASNFNGFKKSGIMYTNTELGAHDVIGH